MSSPTLCFLPGMMCDRQLWEGVWQYMPSNWDIRYIPMERCADRNEMVGLIDEMTDGGDVHMVGFSMGGYLSLEYAVQASKPYRSLTLVGASAYGLPAPEKERRLKYLPMLEKGEYKGISRHRLAQFVHPDRVDDPAVGGVVREMDARLGKEVLINQLTSGSLRESFMDDLPRLACPVQLIGGELDAVIKPSSLHKMESRIADVRLHLLEDTGHMIPLERPEAVAQLLTAFVEEQHATA